MSEIPKEIQMALLTILDKPKADHTKEYLFGEYNLRFDFRKQTFVFATSEPHKVFHALLNRLRRIDLEDYSQKELQEIIKIHTPGVSYGEGVLDDISTVLRGRGHQAFTMAGHIKKYLTTKRRDNEKFQYKDWQELRNIFGINALGLYPTEIQILRILAERTEGTSLTNLSAKTGQSPNA